MKTGLEKMVDVLEKDLSEATHIDHRIIIRGYIEESRRLLELEKAQKPTREELEAKMEAWYSVFGTSQLSHASARLEAAESKVKRLEFELAQNPTSPASLVDIIKYEASLFAEMPTGSMDDIEYSRTKGIAQGLYKAAEIISRYRPAPVNPCAELVERIKYEASLYAEMPTGTMDDYEYNRTKGIAQGLYKAADIISKRPAPEVKGVEKKEGR